MQFPDKCNSSWATKILGLWLYYHIYHSVPNYSSRYVLTSCKCYYYCFPYQRRYTSTLSLSLPLLLLLMVERIRRRGCSSVGRASDRHDVEPGSIPWCGKGFFVPESTFSADSLTVSAKPSCAVACINICAHVKDSKHWQPYLFLDTRKCRTHC